VCVARSSVTVSNAAVCCGPYCQNSIFSW
jgi:hypothetical protein